MLTVANCLSNQVTTISHSLDSVLCMSPHAPYFNLLQSGKPRILAPFIKSRVPNDPYKQPQKGNEGRTGSACEIYKGTSLAIWPHSMASPGGPVTNVSHCKRKITGSELLSWEGCSFVCSKRGAWKTSVLNALHSLAAMHSNPQCLLWALGTIHLSDIASRNNGLLSLWSTSYSALYKSISLNVFLLKILIPIVLHFKDNPLFPPLEIDLDIS